MEARSRGSVGLELRAWEGGYGEGQPEESLVKHAQDSLLQTLPIFTSADINDLKGRGVAVWLASMHLVLYFVVGILLLAAGTVSEYNRQYLALTNDKNNSICETIPVHITETFKADKNGTWITSKFYDPLSTIYELKMTGTKVTDEKYSAVMQNFTAQLKAFGDSTTSLDLIGQQIAWSLFSVNDADTMMELSTDADLARMLGSVAPDFYSLGRVKTGFPVVSSAEGVCMYDDGLLPTFNSQGLVLTASFPDRTVPTVAPAPFPTEIREPTAKPSAAPTPSPQRSAIPTTKRNPTGSPTRTPTASSNYEFCPKQISVGDFRSRNKNSFDISLFNAALAFALNFGIVNTSSLTRADSEEVDYWGGEVGKFLYEIWSSDRYPGSFVQCITKNGQLRVCFSMAGDAFAYPVLTTTKDNYAATPVCLCPEDAQTRDCNRNNLFQLALVFAKDDYWTTIMSAGWKLQSMLKTDGPNKVKSLVAGLAYTAWQLGLYSSYYYVDWLEGRSSLSPYSEFKKSFELMGANISIMSFSLEYAGGGAPFNAGGVILKDLATTKFRPEGYSSNYSQVSCTNTIFRRSALQHMTLKPPVPVVQPYLSCHPTQLRAFLTAAGLAAASSSLVSSIFLTLFVAATVVYFNNHRDRSLKIVAPSEKSMQMAETVKMLQAENQRMSSRMEMLERIVQGSAGLDSRQSRGSELYGDLSDQEHANGQQRRMSRLSMRNSIQQQQEQEQERPSLRKSVSSNGSVSSAPSVARVAVPTSMAGAIAFVSRRHPLETPGLSAGGRASITSAPQHSHTQDQAPNSQL